MDPSSGEFPRLFDFQKSENYLNRSENPGTCYFWKKKAPARKLAHTSPNFGQKLILPKVEFGSNDLSGFEAT